MKTMIRWIALALAVVLGLAPGLMAQTTGAYYFWWLVTDERGEPYTGENVQCSVWRPNQHAAAIIHTSSTLASGGNSPLFSDVNGKLHFWSSQNDPVDITCFYAHGGSAEINKFRHGDHKIQVPRQSFTKVSRFSVSNATTATNASSGITLPAGALVKDVIIQNLNPRGNSAVGITDYHISVGFAGNHAVAANVNALVDAQALTSPDEWLRPHMIRGTAGAVAGLLGVGNHRGAALSVYHTQIYSGAGGTGISYYYERPYLIHVASGLDVTYAVAVSGVGAARVHVFIIWQQLHTGINRLGRTN